MEEKGAVRARMMRAACSPYRFLIAAAVLAAVFSLLPAAGEAPLYAGTETEGADAAARETPQAEAPAGMTAGADLSARTQNNCTLHRTLYYAPCGHSVQRREKLPPALTGLTRGALEAQIGGVVPGAKVTGFSAQEVDVSLETDIPCPLHWVLRTGENGRLQVLQNLTGESLEVVRESETEPGLLPEQTQAQLLDGVVFDDAQALERFLESLDS